ncbi:MAG: hypothetical protein ATN31_11200 [Candidatus Epulonipiscioides saccharophilum]|nr:MAG: hypothetical protein ATN31_11200 [Epulopiscium sp. AS2M-Bin001]
MDWLKNYGVILEKGSYDTILVGKKRNVSIQEHIVNNSPSYSINPNFLGREKYSKNEIIENVIPYAGEFGLFIPMVECNNYSWATELVAPSINTFICCALVNRFIFAECKDRDINFDNERRRLKISYYMGGGFHNKAHVIINIYLDKLRKEHFDDFINIVEKYPLDASRTISKEEYHEIYLFPKSDVMLEDYVKEISYQSKVNNQDDVRTNIYIIDASIPSTHKDYFTRRFEMATLLTNGYTVDTISNQGATVEFANIFYRFYEGKNFDRTKIDVQDILKMYEEIRDNNILKNVKNTKEFNAERYRLAQKFAIEYGLEIEFLEEMIYKKIICRSLSKI